MELECGKWHCFHYGAMGLRLRGPWRSGDLLPGLAPASSLMPQACYDPPMSSAIVPAAGAASRFGGDKMIADVDGVRLLDRTIRSLLDAGVDQVVVVLAPGAAWTTIITGSDDAGPNRRQSRSVAWDVLVDSARCARGGGFTDGRPPGDMPFVRPATIDKLLTAGRRTRGIVAPSFGGRRGHPIVLPGDVRDALIAAEETSRLDEFLASQPTLARGHRSRRSGRAARRGYEGGSRIVRDTLARMAELEREGRRFVVATVVRTHGSTPQVVGSRLIIDDLGPADRHARRRVCRRRRDSRGAPAAGRRRVVAARVLTSPSRSPGTPAWCAAARCGFTSSRA